MMMMMMMMMVMVMVMQARSQGGGSERLADTHPPPRRLPPREKFENWHYSWPYPTRGDNLRGEISPGGYHQTTCCEVDRSYPVPDS